MPNKRSGITRQSEEEDDRLLGKTKQQSLLNMKRSQQKEAERKGNLATYLIFYFNHWNNILCRKTKAKLHYQIKRKMLREDKNVWLDRNWYIKKSKQKPETK